MALKISMLSDVDKCRAKQLICWFKMWKKQGKPAITPEELVIRLRETFGWQYTMYSFPTLINYIRTELNECIALSNDGLFYAETKKEKAEFLKYHESLMYEDFKVLIWIKKIVTESPDSGS
ncbi:MAG: hypothetical protein QME52_13185 [Bacteroidota bacterium]|nr:hypothetical protein [Bacteroidota bacterium]